MKYALALSAILAASTFSCRGPGVLTYRAIIKAMPVNYAITGKMRPAIELIYAENMAEFAGQPAADSLALSETAKEAGLIMVGLYKKGHFRQAGARRKIIHR